MTDRLRRTGTVLLLAATVVLSAASDGVQAFQHRARSSRTAIVQITAGGFGVAAVWDGLGRAWGLSAVCVALLVLEALAD